MRRSFSADPLTPPDPPIRAELFGIERLEQHAESLAVAQPVTTPAGGGQPLLARVEDNARVLRASYRVIATAIREERARERPVGQSCGCRAAQLPPPCRGDP